jgi:hypothetical protein
MWRCPHCGEHVDDEFETCWKCGTAADGTPDPDFQAERALDSGSPAAAGDDSNLSPPSGRPDRIVEIYSAANAIEANSLCDALAEAGIEAQVVGEMLGNAGGWLPAAATAPRIWVRHADEADARKIMVEWNADRGAQDTTAAVDNEEPATVPTDGGEDTATSPEGPGEEGPKPFTVVGKCLVGLGLALILFGAAYAWRLSLVADRHPAETTAECIAYYWGDHWEMPTRVDSDLPLPRGIVGSYGWRHGYQYRYRYEVDGSDYDVDLQSNVLPSRQLVIHYNPQNPADCLIGTLTPPWLVLVLTALIGSFLLFVAYQFR